jgi:hypothetical protein
VAVFGLFGISPPWLIFFFFFFFALFFFRFSPVGGAERERPCRVAWRPAACNAFRRPRGPVALPSARPRRTPRNGGSPPLVPRGGWGGPPSGLCSPELLSRARWRRNSAGEKSPLFSLTLPGRPLLPLPPPRHTPARPRRGRPRAATSGGAGRRRLPTGLITDPLCAAGVARGACILPRSGIFAPSSAAAWRLCGGGRGSGVGGVGPLPEGVPARGGSRCRRGAADGGEAGRSLGSFFPPNLASAELVTVGGGAAGGRGGPARPARKQQGRRCLSSALWGVVGGRPRVRVAGLLRETWRGGGGGRGGRCVRNRRASTALAARRPGQAPFPLSSTSLPRSRRSA